MAPLAAAAIGVAGALLAHLVAPHAACPKVVPYTLQQEQALATSVQQLQPTDPMVGAMADYVDLRKRAKACVTGAK